MDPAPSLLTARGSAARGSGEVVLEAAGLSVRRGEALVVQGADLALRRGEVVAVLGPNGAGKSSLLAALAGLIPTAAGSVRRDGRVAAGLQAPALARRTVQANVEAALGWWGAPRPERAGRARAALDALHAGALAERLATTLSGGEARRVHLARVLALDPDALLLDEPFAGLDASSRADLLYDAASVLRSPRRATLVVVHDRAEAWALADRLVVLIDGRVAASGRPAEVLEAPPSVAVAAFLGFTGRIEEDGEMLLTRPSHVALDALGPLEAVVARRVPVEDGVRLELTLARGRLVAVAPPPGPASGDRVRVRVTGGVRFPARRTEGLRSKI